MIKTMKEQEILVIKNVVVEQLEIIESNGSSALDIHSNYESFEVGKTHYKKDNDAEVIYLDVTEEYGVACMGITVEDAKAIIKTLQSIVDYMEN